MDDVVRARDALRLPSLVSFTRLALAAAFPFALERPIAASAVIAAAGASDVLDGWLARRRNEVTAMGALIDGVTDKVFVTSVVVTLALHQRLTLLEVALLSTREIFEAPVLAWRLLRPAPVARERRANALGKATTALQVATLFGVVLRIGHALPLIGAAALGVAAGISYALEELKSRPSSRAARRLRLASAHMRQVRRTDGRRALVVTKSMAPRPARFRG